MHIAYITDEWRETGGGYCPGTSAWVRLWEPAQALADRGHRVTLAASLAPLPDGRLLPVHRDGTPSAAGAPDLIVSHLTTGLRMREVCEARAAGQVIVADVDDWFWDADDQGEEFCVDPAGVLAGAAKLAAVDAVTVSSRYLADELPGRMPLGGPTILLRNMVDPDRFPVAPVSEATSGLRVGWVGWITNRKPDLRTLRPWFDRWLTRSGSVFVHHGTLSGDGTTAAAALAGVRPSRTGRTRPVVGPPDYPDLLTGFDIGIVPLRDCPQNHAKSFLKGLEYAAAGVPFVAQRTAEYEALGAGLLASTPREWAAALDALACPDRRRQEQERGLQAVTRWSRHSQAGEWESAYADLLARTARLVKA